MSKQKFPLYLTDEERKLIRAAAGLSDMSMTTFITQIVLAHAHTVLDAHAAQPNVPDERNESPDA